MRGARVRTFVTSVICFLSLFAVAAQVPRDNPGVAPGASNATLPPAPEPGPMVTYATVYYPGTTNVAQAAIVTLGPNEERDGVDFSTQLVPTAKITGTVIGADGQPGRYTLTARGTPRAPGPPPGRGAVPDMAEIQAQMGMMTGDGGAS